MCALTILAPSLATAIELGWSPGMYLNPGDGVRLYDMRTPAFSELVQLGPVSTNLNTGYQDELITLVQHSYDAVKTLSGNGSLNLIYQYTKVDLSASYFGSQTYDANTVKFVFTKTHNFGKWISPPLDFTPNAKSLISTLQKNWQGEALHASMVNAFGTHYVAGVEKAHTVSVLFNFGFSSATQKQRFTLSASGGDIFDIASFSSYVSSYFASTDTTTSVTYTLYSTDPSLPTGSFPFPAGNHIGSLQDFTNLVSALEAYSNAMTPTNAATVGLSLNPIQTMPGYLQLVGGYLPPPILVEDYHDFLEAYATLELWHQRLANRGSMAWLNPAGQQVIFNNLVDVNDYLSAMQTSAANHVNTGAPLQVPQDVVTYLANLTDLRLPQIFVMNNWQWSDGTFLHHTVIGRVDCGNSDLVFANPFGTISVTNGNTGTTVQLAYPPSVENTLLNNRQGANNSGNVTTHLQTLFASEQWNCLTNGNPDVNAYFVITEPNSAAASWNISINYQDLWTAQILLLDDLPFYSTRSGGCITPSTLSSNVNVAIVSISPPTNGVVGIMQPISVVMTNSGPIQAYGTAVSFALSNSFAFGGGSGSQGYADAMDPSTRTVTYHVGPIRGNGTANINLNLIPLQSGTAMPGTVPILAFAAGLTNAVTNTATFFPIAAASPEIGLAKLNNRAQLDWWADTSHLQAEGSLALGSSAPWTSVTNNALQTVNGSHRFLSISATNQQRYFRLHSE